MLARLPLLIAALFALPSTAAPSGAADAFGFRDYEIYELSFGSFDLEKGDLNGDGRLDVALIDNRRSRIEFLLRLEHGAEAYQDNEKEERANSIRYDGRFERRRHPVERRVLALEVADWNGDGLSDAAWISDGGRLSVLISSEGKALELSYEQTLDPLRKGCTLFVSCDLDRDGKAELLAAGPEKLLWVRDLDKPVFTTRTIDSVGSNISELFVADLNGDRLDDLLYVSYQDDLPFRFRLGEGAGHFGPRVDVEMPQVRSASVCDLDGDGRSEVLSIFRLSGRLSMLELTNLPGSERSLLRYPFGRAENRSQRRTFAVGDLDGDAAVEIVVAHPDVAEVSLFTRPDGALNLRRRSFPSFVGVSEPKIGDIDGDGRAELVIRSTSERMLGVARLDEEGELPFPITHAVDGEPAAMDLADVDGDGLLDVALIVTTGEGRKREYGFEVWHGSSEGLASPTERHSLKGFKKVPYALEMIDLDRDGAQDAIAFVPGDNAVPYLLLQREGEFVVDERGKDIPGLGILEGATPANVSQFDLDGDDRVELVAASSNFARALSFVSDGNGRVIPRVVEQFNGVTSDSEISACALAEIDGIPPLDIVLRDERSRELLILGRGPEGDTHVRTRVAAGGMDFSGLVPADVDGDHRTDLIVMGQEQFGVLLAESSGYTLREFASYDPPKEGSFLDRLGSGDLDGDGSREIVVSELQNRALVLLQMTDRELSKALGFEVYEKKGLADESAEREPREIETMDLDGDGKTDLAILIHDKMIVYLQE